MAPSGFYYAKRISVSVSSFEAFSRTPDYNYVRLLIRSRYFTKRTADPDQNEKDPQGGGSAVLPEGETGLVGDVVFLLHPRLLPGKEQKIHILPSPFPFYATPGKYNFQTCRGKKMMKGGKKGRK